MLDRVFGALADPTRRAAAMFFLTDVYGDHDFSRRDADIARVIPIMRPLLPAVLEVVYLIFNEGYAATAGDDVRKDDTR